MNKRVARAVIRGMRPLLVASAGLLLACPTASLKPVRVELRAEDGGSAATLELSRREICWPLSRDPLSAGERLALRLRVEVRGEVSVAEPWTLRRIGDGAVMRAISAGGEVQSGASRARVIVFEQIALPPGNYAVSVPLRQGGRLKALEAPIAVVPCVYY